MTGEEKISRICEALVKARYSNISREGRVHALTAAVTACAQRKGQAMPGHAAETTASALDAEIDRYFGRELAFDEVMLALDWGVHREFGEYSGINVDRLFDFVRLYRACPERQEASSRMKSLAAASPDNLHTPDVGRLNWEAMMRYTRRAWREWKDESGGDGGMLAGALAVARRVLMASSYKWLKAEGVVTTDAGTMAFENRARRAAAEKHGGKSSPPAVEQYAMQACLLEVFRLCDRDGFDLMGALDELENNTPPEDRRFY